MAFAIGKKHIEAIRGSLSDGSPTAATKTGLEALMRASLTGRTAEVKALLDRGADANAKDLNGWTPLMEAAFGGHAETIQALSDRGADVNARDRTGWTPLMEAASKGHADAVKALLACGADAKAESAKGWTALKATPRLSAEIIRLLRQAGAER